MSIANATFRKARVILVGSGRMGQIRGSLLNSSPKFDMVGICDVNVSGAQSMADKYSALPFSSIQEAIAHFGVRGHAVDAGEDTCASSSIDGVVMCSPTFAHDEAIREVADYGLPIFVEKPVDEDANKVKDIFDYCEKKGAKLCCGFQRRFDDSYVAVAEAVKQGQIGKPISATIFFGDHPCPPMEFLLTGGEIFMDLAPHDIDFIRNILNDEVSTVYATGSSSTDELKEARVYDNGTMVMTFKKGAVVTITMSRSAVYGYDQRVEIFGTGGLATVGNPLSNSSVIAKADGFHQPKLKYSFPQRYKQANKSELEAFAETILNDAEWPITSQDCINVQAVANAARISSQENRIVHL